MSENQWTVYQITQLVREEPVLISDDEKNSAEMAHILLNLDKKYPITKPYTQFDSNLFKLILFKVIECLNSSPDKDKFKKYFNYMAELQREYISSSESVFNNHIFLHILANKMFENLPY